MNLNQCHDCGRKIDCDSDKYKYAVLWGPDDQPASIAGVLCMLCSEKYKDITEEVTG